MAGTIGVTGEVSSWIGTVNAAVLAQMKPAAFTLNQTAQEFDTTGYDASDNLVIASTYLKGLRGWSGTMEGFHSTPVAGTVASISGTSYSANARSWDIQIECDAKDVSAFTQTNNWRTFLPGLQRWSGSYECLVDDTTPITPVLGSADGTAEPLTGTFTMSSGNTWAGSIFTTGASITSRVGDLNVVRYTFRGSSDLTVAGTAALFAANNGTQAAMANGTLTMLMATGRSMAGSAFITRAALTCTQGDVTRVSLAFQGSGALTHA